MDRKALNTFDNTYHTMLRYILKNGNTRGDRTGTGTISVFGYQNEYDLSNGNFPLITTKKVWWHGVVQELLWMLSGSTNIKPLQEVGVHIWDEWADEDGDLGNVYGAQWRKWCGVDLVNDVRPYNPVYIDQITDVIERIKTKPEDRRLIVSAWNVADIGAMALPPCHCFFQFYVREVQEPLLGGGAQAMRYLDLKLYQRSADVFLGVPFNIASYSLLLLLVARCTGLTAGRFIHSFGDLHIYSNHMEQVKEQLSRGSAGASPIVDVVGSLDIDLITAKDITLEEYTCHDAIKAPVAV